MTRPLAYLAAALLVAAGCQRYRRAGASYGLEASYLTAGIKSFTAGLSGETPVDLPGRAGLPGQTDVWGGELAYANGPDIYGAGYSKILLTGRTTVADQDITFGGQTFTVGTDIRTRANFDIYKVFVANRATDRSGGVNQFAFVLEFLDFDISIRDDATPANVGRFDRRAPMLLLGYQWETVGSGSGTVYFAKIEWMDLDVIRIGRTGGNFTDLTAGLKWYLGGPNARSQLVIAYRYFEANLDIDGEKMYLSFDGPVVGLSAWF